MAKRTHEQQIQGFLYIYVFSIEKTPFHVFMCSEVFRSGRVGWRNSVQFLSKPDQEVDFLED
ncbi:MAG: hypothetical protein EHM85_11225 [Desulfobacteraceae bacterium]|nr:MAG: hypothetical protein EHM85_11225 [Desulfobacteraceae bacterium]